jgi:hypothetical protein
MIETLGTTTKTACTITQTLSQVTATANVAFLTASVATCGASTTRSMTYAFVPDVAGTYTIQVFADGSVAETVADGVLNGAEVAKTISITAVENPAATTVLTQPVAGVGATTKASNAASGLWVKLTFRDAAAAASRLGTGQQAVLTIPTGLTLQKVNGTTVSATASDYGLNNSVTDTAGAVWLNFVSATAGTYNLSAKVGSGTATTLAVQFATADAIAVASAAFGLTAATTALNIEASAGAVNDAASTANVPTVATASSFIVRSAAVGKKVVVRVADTSRVLFGTSSTLGALKQDIVVTTAAALGTTASTTGYNLAGATVTLPSVALTTDSRSGAARTYKLSTQPTDVDTAIGDATLPLTVSGTASTAGAWTIAPATTVSVVNGGAITFTAECDDQYLAAMAGRAVTAQITAGRNIQTLSTALITDAAGKVSFTVTDTKPTSATLTDTVTFAGCNADATVTINYVTSLAASTLTMSPVTTSTTPSSAAISTSSATAWDGSVTVTATAKDAAGIAVVGLPVTLTMPASVTLKSTSTAVAYTNALGVAS